MGGIALACGLLSLAAGRAWRRRGAESPDAATRLSSARRIQSLVGGLVVAAIATVTWSYVAATVTSTDAEYAGALGAGSGALWVGGLVLLFERTWKWVGAGIVVGVPVTVFVEGFLLVIAIGS